VGWRGLILNDSINLNWHNIRPIDGDQKKGFEEFVSQLARIEPVPNPKQFIRKGTPDAGVECYWILDDDSEFAWQAKYFTSSLEGSQWNQISKSVEAAIEGHQNISRYIVALPIDPSDGKSSGKETLQKKWDDHVQNWLTLANSKGRTIQFVPWWSSDLIKRLQNREALGFIRFWFDRDFLSNEWFSRHIDKSIADLQQRYTPELNYQMPIAKIFDGIARDDKFLKQFFHFLDPLLIEINSLSIRDDNQEYNKIINEIKNIAKTIRAEYNIISESHENNYNFEYFTELCNQIHTLISKIIENNGITRDRKYEITKIFSSLNEFEDFINGITIKLYNKPYLLITGEAGIGKSHLLGDIVTLRKFDNKYSLLLLGQQFNSTENPETQILKNLDINCTFQELLTTLSSRAQIMKSRLIIFIDALNEGKGVTFWPSFFSGFVMNFQNYPWIGLVLTIRDTYVEALKTSMTSNSNLLLRYKYNGFSGKEYNATKMFFSFYGIEQPSNPILNPEFRNPLFLKLYCGFLKSKNMKRIPDGFYGISELAKFHVNYINDILSDPICFDYSKGINLVERSINSIIKYMLKNRTKIIAFETAIEIIENCISNIISTGGKFLDKLISEGIFTKYLENKAIGYNEYIYFTYERFSDHLFCNFLLESSQDLEKDLKPNGYIYQFLVSSDKPSFYYLGLLEALAIQLPEKTGKEIYNYLDVNIFPGLIENFLQSLKWRRLDTISANCLDFIESYINQDDFYFEQFFDTILSVTTVERHFFNAYFLHNYLMQHSMADRDSFWSYYLKNKYSEDEGPVKRLIDWAWEDDDKDHISDESIKLASIAIVWFLSSSNRAIRDSSTKALISILQIRMPILIDTLKYFETVNDPYIYERLFAVAYGCALRTKQINELSNLAEYIYKVIFIQNKEIYPHILLRDYARNIIEYANYMNIPLSFDIKKVRPPYKSNLVIKKITNKQIDEKYRSSKNNSLPGQDDILSSMVTEYSRGTGGYGDFGRYVFQYKFDNFSVKPDVMSNMAIELIFEKYGYSEEKHGYFEKNLPFEGRQSKRIERIGKKYQWIAMHELLAKVTDNCKKQSRYQNDQEGNSPYQGPWEPFVRDIDPTLLIKRTGYLQKDKKNILYWWEKNYKFNYDSSIGDWLTNTTELSVFKSIIKAKDEKDNSWLLIQAYPNWAEDRKIGEKEWSIEKKEIWIHVRSYICNKDDMPKIIKWAKKQNFSGRWMPENIDKHVLFFRESYWSPAYKYCVEENYDGNLVDIWEEIKDNKTCKIIASVIIPTEEYTWEKDTDYSIDDTFNIIVPSKYLFNNLKMKYGDVEGEYFDNEHNLICYNPSVKYNSKQYLLIREEPLLKFLKENELEIFWTILGEKQILGGDFKGFHGRLDFSGVYHLNNDGSISSSIHTFRLPGRNEVQ